MYICAQISECNDACEFLRLFAIASRVVLSGPLHCATTCGRFTPGVVRGGGVNTVSICMTSYQSQLWDGDEDMHMDQTQGHGLRTTTETG